MRVCPACAFDRCDDTAERCRQCGADLGSVEESSRNPALAAAWFHYLVIPKIGTVELVPGRAFRIGREPRCELVLPKVRDPELATIFWTDGNEEATVKPTPGAAAKVRVEGIFVTTTRTLKGGEELEVGPLRMSYQKRAQAIEGAIDARKVGGSRADPRRAVAGPRDPMGGGTLEPRVRQLPTSGGGPKVRTVQAAPAQVARALEQRKATGTLRVESRRGRGWVTIMSGTPRHAAYGDLKGRAALQAMLRLPQARCQLDDGLPRRGAGKEIDCRFSDLLPRAAPPGRPGARPPAAPPGRGGVRPPGRRGPPRGRPR